MAKIDQAIAWMEQRKGKVTYSMNYRTGPHSYDCSSAVYFALRDAGLLPQNIAIGNTETLFHDLESNGWTQVRPDASGNYRHDVATCLFGVAVDTPTAQLVTPAFSMMTTTRLSIATLATMAFPSIRTTRFGCITVLLQSRFIVPLQK